MSRCRRPRWRNGLSRALRPYLFIGLFGVGLATAYADPPPVPPSAQVPSLGAPADPPPTQPRPLVAVQAVAASPMDQPLRLVAEARQTYAKVRDYTCTMIKQERVNGQLQPENIIAVKFRTQPFSIYMKWSAPREFLGQEVCFVNGQNKGMMRVHASGILGVAGFVSIDPRDPKVMQNSRHTIYEAGMGNLIEQLGRSWEGDRRVGKTQSRVAEYEYNKRRCIRVETYHTERLAQAYCWRSVVYFDKETRLPIRTETYDWPRPGGDPGGDRLETFSYIDMHFNLGLSDQAFSY